MHFYSGPPMHLLSGVDRFALIRPLGAERHVKSSIYKVLI
jgi:hypothetical protein